MKVSFVGIGRLGGAFALALSKKGYEIETFVAKDLQRALEVAEEIYPKPKILSPNNLESLSSSEVIFITTQDKYISSVADLLSLSLSSKPFVFHCSGSLTSREVLEGLKRKGCSIGSIHPLVSISDSFSGVKQLKDCFFCIEGDAEALKIAEKIVIDLQGRPFAIPTDCKALYHASAVMSAGNLLTVFALALQMLSACGLEESKAQQVLLPLARSVIENLQSQTPEKALTGPFARNDLETLQKHIEALKNRKLLHLLEIYLRLGKFSLDLVEKRNPDLKEQTEKMRDLISESLASLQTNV